MTDSVNNSGASAGVSAATQAALDEIQADKEKELIRLKKEEIRNEQMTKLASNMDKVRF